MILVGFQDSPDFEDLRHLDAMTTGRVENKQSTAFLLFVGEYSNFEHFSIQK